MKKHWTVKTSSIHGKGVFVEKKFKKGENIWIGIDYYFNMFPYITEFGSMVNHSWLPSAKLVYSPKDEVYYVQAKNKISKGEEITLNYTDTPWYVNDPEDWW